MLQNREATDIGIGEQASSSKPTVVTTVIFLLLFSGPPMFRMRDPNESLEGAIDYVVVLRLIVLVIGGMWLLYQWRTRRKAGMRGLPFAITSLQGLGLALVACLAVSVFVSASPSLTGFKVCEMLISLSFTATFVGIYGVDECLSKIFVGATLLCAAIAICVFIAPDMVLFATETEALRLRGELIAPTEIVASFGLILLVARARKPSPLWFWSLFAFFGILLAASLSRTAYAIIIVFLAMYLWKAKKRIYAYLVSASVAALLLIGFVPSLGAYRNTESIFSLSDRVGLWAYLAAVTLQKSPWIGLGYYSASRIYGPEYNEGLGTAHSMFFEAFIGGGLVALSFVIALCAVGAFYAIKLLPGRGASTTFAASTLFITALLFGSIGGDFGYGPLGITFWSLCAILPILYERRGVELSAQRLRGPALRSPVNA
ncbi:MAG TPA: O-antigen ligase family protein [Candidatus Acidoferrum sp.]|jgi:hypothetical protein